MRKPKNGESERASERACFATIGIRAAPLGAFCGILVHFDPSRGLKMDQDRSGCRIEVPSALRPAPNEQRPRVIQKHDNGRRRNQFSLSLSPTLFFYLFALNFRNSMNAASSSAPCSGDLNHSETMEASWIACVDVRKRGGEEKKDEFVIARHLEVFSGGGERRERWWNSSPRRSDEASTLSLALLSLKQSKHPHLIVVRRRVAQGDREQPIGTEVARASIVAGDVAGKGPPGAPSQRGRQHERQHGLDWGREQGHLSR